jgi:predicted deacetylase
MSGRGPDGAGRAVVVSLHDVSPMTRGTCDAMLRELEGIGIQKVSLLVIPDHHGKGHFLKDRPFCDWLRDRVNRGCEPVIHGYHHRRQRRSGEGFLTRWITRSYTADEGEFYDLSEEEARARVEKAKKEFGEIGLMPDGFIAPAWLLGPDAERGARRAKIRYTVRLGGVIDLADGGGSAHSQSLVYSVRSGWRRAISLRWNPFLYARLSGNPLLRVSLHPPDFKYPDVWRQAIGLIRDAVDSGRVPMTYGEWVG